MALALGYAHPDHLLRELTSWQITEWLAYYQIEPWGEERGDLRAGIVASVTANANRDPKHRKRPYTPQDFMPTWDPPEPASVDNMIRMVEMMNAALGGEDRRKKR